MENHWPMNLFIAKNIGWIGNFCWYDFKKQKRLKKEVYGAC
jgi:hypothetical protein